MTNQKETQRPQVLIFTEGRRLSRIRVVSVDTGECISKGKYSRYSRTRMLKKKGMFWNKGYDVLVYDREDNFTLWYPSEGDQRDLNNTSFILDMDRDNKLDEKSYNEMMGS